MNMPMLCRPYNPYSPASAIQTIASPSNTFAHSPGNSSTYSASPIQSPQQQMQPEDFLRYGMPHAFQPQSHVAQPTNDYGFYYNNDYGMKRRKRDDEVRTA